MRWNLPLKSASAVKLLSELHFKLHRPNFSGGFFFLGVFVILTCTPGDKRKPPSPFDF